MGPITWRTISHIAVFLGSGLALVGGIGTWYFGNQVERIMPYRQPIKAASVIIEVTVASDEQVNTHYIDRGGYLIFANSQEKIMVLSSQDSWARQLGQDRVLYKGIFHMDANDPSTGKPVNLLQEAKYVQIFFHMIPIGKEVLGGKAVCIINNNVRFEIDIPQQLPTQIQGKEAEGRNDSNLIFVRDLEQSFIDFKN